MKHLIVLTAALALLAGCTQPDAPEGDGEPTSSLPDVEVWLTVTDSIGVEMGNEDLMLGMPAMAAWLPGDRIAVLDMQKHRIALFTPEGEFLTALGRQGSGPGEFLLPSYVAVTPSGGLVVCDAMAGQLSFFDPDLQYARALSGFYPSPPVVLVFQTDSSFVGMKPEFEQTDQGMFSGFQIARWNTSSPEPEQVFHLNMRPFDLANIGNFTEGMVLFAAGTDGSVYTNVFSSEEYVVRGWNYDGTERFVISEPFTRVSKTPTEIEEEREFVQSRMLQGGAPQFMADAYEPDPFKIAVSGLNIAPDGNLWVNQGVYDRPVFRVYDPASGDYLFTAALDRDLDLTVTMNPWGITGTEPLSGDWPRVYLISVKD